MQDAQAIENWSERIFAIAVLSIPHLDVYWEPDEFKNRKGVTLPDFRVVNTRQREPKMVYVEVTGDKKLTGGRKTKQRNVMKSEKTVDPSLRYTQLPRKLMTNIERRLKNTVR